MSTREPGPGSGDLIISGRVGALRELAAPAPMSDAQVKIVNWYGELVRLLSGPRSGDERGPAQQPSWVKQGPRIENIELASEERLEYVIDGSGFASTQEVWVDGRATGGWEVVGHGRLTIPVPGDDGAGDGDQVTIMIRTADGDVAIQVRNPATSDA
jgi:hypothetical protein